MWPPLEAQFLVCSSRQSEELGVISFQSNASLPAPKLGLAFLTFLHFPRIILLLQMLCRSLHTARYGDVSLTLTQEVFIISLCRGQCATAGRHKWLWLGWMYESQWMAVAHLLWRPPWLWRGTPSAYGARSPSVCFQTSFHARKAASVPRKLHVAVAETPRVRFCPRDLLPSLFSSCAFMADDISSTPQAQLIIFLRQYRN